MKKRIAKKVAKNLTTKKMNYKPTTAKRALRKASRWGS
jgi:hypothetical protein